MPDSSKLIGRLEEVWARTGERATADQLDKLEAYLLCLERWNRTINLTALPLTAFPDQAIDRLVKEPLDACSLITTQNGLWYDLGSGTGSPAIPMAIRLPLLQLVMVESRGRKAAFLREAARIAGLRTTRVIGDRIESLVVSEAGGSASLVSLRAVRIDTGVARTIDHLLSQSGEVLLFGSADWSALSSEFESQESTGTTVVLRRCVPRGTSTPISRE